MKSFFSTTSISEPRPAPASTLPHLANLTSGRLLAGNAIWNLIGTCSPILVAVVCLPVLKHALGTDRLGVITLAWVFIGYFGLFDFGLSRALTNLVAEKFGQRQFHEIPALVWTSLYIMAALGLVGAILTFALSPWLVQRFVKVPTALQRETLYAFYWLSLSIPLVVITAGLRGVLEALQRFRLATAIRVPMGVFTYLGPVCVLPFSRSLVPIMAALVLGRAAACIAHLWACLHSMSELRHDFRFSSSALRPLFRFGSWMTVTNVVGPMMVTFDRFVIGAMISVAAVAYYAVPSEVVTKILLIPAAIIGVLFPAFSTAHAANRERLVLLFESGIKYILIALFPITLALVAFAPQGLRFWLGVDFAHNSTLVVRCLLVGVFLNSLSLVPFALIQSVGRPDLTAKLHLFELPLYVAMLVPLVKFRSIEGAAIAWLLRFAIDALLLFVLAFRFLPARASTGSRLPAVVAAALLFFALASVAIPFYMRVLLVSTVWAFFFMGAWFWSLSNRERSFVQSGLRGANVLS